VSGTATGPQETYWRQLVTCKVVSCYVRLYRDGQAKWINGTGIFKAVVTSSTIGAWAIWRDYAFVWGVLLAAAQIVDAVKEYMPQTKDRRQASEFIQAMESLIIDARFEWFAVSTGDYTAAEIMERWRKLSRLMHEIETKYFLDGLPVSGKWQKLAVDEAKAYFLSAYGEGIIGDE